MDGRHLHSLRRFLSTLQFRLTDGVQLQLLAFRHSGLQTHAAESAEITGVSEAGEDLGDAGGSLDLEGEVHVVFLVCGVGLGVLRLRWGLG